MIRRAMATTWGVRLWSDEAGCCWEVWPSAAAALNFTGMHRVATKRVETFEGGRGASLKATTEGIAKGVVGLLVLLLGPGLERLPLSKPQLPCGLVIAP